MPQFRDNFHSEEAQEIMGRAPSCALLEIENGKAYPGVILL